MPFPPVEPEPTPWLLDATRADPGDDLVAAGADLQPGTLLAAYRLGLFPMGLGPHGSGTVGLVVARPARRLPGRGAAGAAVAAQEPRPLRGAGRHRLRRGRPAVRRPVPRRPLDHRRGRRGVRAAARARLGPQRRGVAGRPARRRALRRLGRRPVRRGVDVPHGARRVEGGARRRSSSASSPTATPAGIVDVQWATDHLQRLGAQEWERERYLAALRSALEAPQVDLSA